MEVDAAFARDRCGLEEQVHQYGLAATDITENIEALDRLASACTNAEQPAERRRFARPPALGELGFEPAQPADHCLLLGVAFDRSGGDTRCIERGGGNRHEE